MPPRAEAVVPVLAGLFPPGVAVGALAVSNPHADAGTRTAEQAAAARRTEFETGRVLARGLIESIGRAGGAIGVGIRRAPIWPAGLVGSIAHSHGVCVAAVAPAESFAALGIDLEPDEPLEPALWPTVLRPSEVAGVDVADSHRAGEYARLVFSAKESVFKAQFPLTGADLEFGQVSIRWHRAGGGFAAEFSGVPSRVSRLSARIRGASRVAGGCIVTSAWVEHDSEGQA